ncbi:MAG: multiheme c-type cytochrome [Planctomycetia bacterium]|nr:multiheme c-type cytochrome [Planctomycetia bacterium]
MKFTTSVFTFCFLLAAVVPFVALTVAFVNSVSPDGMNGLNRVAVSESVTTEGSQVSQMPKIENATSPFAPAEMPIPVLETPVMKNPVQETQVIDNLALDNSAMNNSAMEWVTAKPAVGMSVENGEDVKTVTVNKPASAETDKVEAEKASTKKTKTEKTVEAVNAEVQRPSRYGIDSTKPFDPVKENGEIFQGWPKPEVTLVLTGRLNGYMEPCGCAGMERMTGGLSRQSEFFQDLKKKGWNPLILDVGGISPGVTKQAQMKFLATVNMLREMEYDAITFGTIDLNFPCADILAEVANPGHAGKLFTSANVGLFDFDSELLPPAKITSRNGVKIGVVGVLGEKEREQVRNDEVVFRSPKLVLAQLIPKLKAQCQFIILLSHATVEESKEFAREFPDIDIIVSSDGTPVPPAVPEVIPETGQYFITIGEKGMNVIVLGLYDDDSQPLRYQRVPMDSRFPSSKKILELMGMYQEQLRIEGLEGLGVRPLKNPRMKSNGLYVGSKRCESCHQESYKVWKKSRHAIAWKSLETSNPPRIYDPECIACHVVGWNAEHRMPFQSGFMNMQESAHLSNVGCESCHGPGSLHMNAEIGSNEKLQEKYRAAMRMDEGKPKEIKNICIQCHDLDNSPNFNFERYYKCIEHHEEREEEDYYEP